MATCCCCCCYCFCEPDRYLDGRNDRPRRGENPRPRSQAQPGGLIHERTTRCFVNVSRRFLSGLELAAWFHALYRVLSLCRRLGRGRGRKHLFDLYSSPFERDLYWSCASRAPRDPEIILFRGIRRSNRNNLCRWGEHARAHSYVAIPSTSPPAGYYRPRAPQSPIKRKNIARPPNGGRTSRRGYRGPAVSVAVCKENLNISYEIDGDLRGPVREQNEESERHEWQSERALNSSKPEDASEDAECAAKASPG